MYLLYQIYIMITIGWRNKENKKYNKY